MMSMLIVVEKIPAKWSGETILVYKVPGFVVLRGHRLQIKTVAHH